MENRFLFRTLFRMTSRLHNPGVLTDTLVVESALLSSQGTPPIPSQASRDKSCPS